MHTTLRALRITTLPALVGLSLLFAPSAASAIPRFSARTGMQCIQCHLNPTGGGMRNAYGRSVFETTMLPFSARPGAVDWDEVEREEAEAAEAAESSDSSEEETIAEEEDEGPFVDFTGEINEWFAIGTDLRLAYIHVRPDEGPTPEEEPNVTNSFFLMQADIYFGATVNEHLTLVIDMGIYSGFEAWGLFTADPQPDDFNLMIKVGRFMPAFGIREVEHQLFTRGGVGLGNADRDTGVEATIFAGPAVANLAVVNGTLGDTAFDTHGSERREFEKAFVARLSVDMTPGPLRLQLGGSFSFNDNVAQVNPMFGTAIPNDLLGEVPVGLDEIRAGAFMSANIGRFTYLADLVYVRDDFNSERLFPLEGYALYQELSFTPVRGIDLVGTFEFMDPDMEIIGDPAYRVGAVVEFFPWSYTELRAMVRRRWDRGAPARDEWDFVLFAHLFM